MKYDYVIVGAGLYGATFANLAKKDGKKVLVIEKRNHIAGNIYTEEIEGINVHKYGAHIFHTDDKEVWNYVNSFVEFNRYTNSPVARYKNEIYNMPFNMNTFAKIWDDVITPEDAKRHMEEERKEMEGKTPKNLEEQAISLVGRTIYKKLVKGYTEKQWNRECIDLPAFIIKRLPVRFIYDNNYFNDKYQGIPIGGYTKLVEGRLEYRSLRFDTQILDTDNFQGNAVVNYTGREVDYTRVIEHKHFESTPSKKTVVTYEYPDDWTEEKEAYYVINDEKNNNRKEEYQKLVKQEQNVIFGGRLAEYKYYDMDDVIRSAMDTYNNQ